MPRGTPRHCFWMHHVWRYVRRAPSFAGRQCKLWRCEKCGLARELFADVLPRGGTIVEDRAGEASPALTASDVCPCGQDTTEGCADRPIRHCPGRLDGEKEGSTDLPPCSCPEGETDPCCELLAYRNREKRRGTASTEEEGSNG